MRADPPLIQARGPGSAWAIFARSHCGPFDARCRGPQPWRRVPLTVLSAGVFLTELVGADLSSCRAQNLRRSGADGSYVSGAATDVVGSASVRRMRRATAQIEPRSAEIGSTSLPSDEVRREAPWQVAGVDYCVGYETNIVLKSPEAIAMAGVSVNTTTHIVTVTGNNVTLDGYDVSLNGGWQVNVQAANTKIANSNFVVGSNDLLPIVGTPTASNLDVVNCTIDGAGHSPGPWGTLIAYRGMSFTVEYSWLKNSGGDMIQTIGGAGTITIEHNLIQNAGMSPGGARRLYAARRRSIHGANQLQYDDARWRGYSGSDDPFRDRFCNLLHIARSAIPHGNDDGAEQLFR